MTTFSRKNTGINSEWSDEDYVRRFNLDPKLIGKGKELDAAIEKAIKETTLKQRVLNDPEE